MIRNENEYQEMLRKLSLDVEFLALQRRSLEEMELSAEQIEKAMQPALSFHEQLKEEVDYYERIKRRDFEAIRNFEGLGRLFIALRIAQGLTQKELADKLGIAETQISRYERNEYFGISIERAGQIIRALGLVVESRVVDNYQPPSPELVLA